MKTSILGMTASTVLSALMSTLIGGVAASAETAVADAGGGLEEVLVTATRRSENQQTVPVAVQAITATDLAKQGVFETSDLNHAMPNLQVSSPYGQQQPNFSLRGIGVGTEFNANAASPVGVYVDEVYQAFRASHGQQLYDLQQVEVVRGPQGTLYGRNTTGGAINFITRQPELEEGVNGTLTVGYGNYDRKNAEGAFEFTPITDKLGLRIAGTYVESDPYVRNVLPAGVNTAAAGGASGLNKNSGIDPGGEKNTGVRATLRFQPTAAIDVSLKGYTAKSEGGTVGPVAFGQDRSSDTIDYLNPNFSLNPLFQALSPAGLLPANYSPSANELSSSLNSYQIQQDRIGNALTETNGGVLTGKFSLSDSLKLISVTGVDSGTYLQSSTDCDATPLTLCELGYNSNFHAFNQDVRLDYAAGRTKLIVGAYYGADSVTSNNKPDFFNFLRDVNAALGNPPTYFNPANNFAAALPPGSLPTGVTTTQRFRQDRESFAVYGEGSYELTDSLRLTAGVRYTQDKNDFKEGITTYYDDTGAPRLVTVSSYAGPYLIQPIGLLPASTDPFPSGLRRSGESNKFSGRLILDWKLNDDIMTYGSYSRGYRAGTFNGLAYGSSDQVYFVPPEEVDAFEIGLKSRFFNDRLQVNSAVFHNVYKGQQEQVVDATATANLVSLDGKIDGLEVDVEFAATDSLRLNAGVGLLHSKYDSATCPSTPLTGYPAQIGNCVASSGGNVSVGGNPFPYAAEESLNLGFDWDAFAIGTGEVSFHGDAAYTGDFYYDAFKDYSRGPLTHVTTGAFTEGGGDYWVVNGRMTYTLDRYSISAWGKNLTNHDYYPFGIAIENLFANGYRVLAPPRTYGVEVTMAF